MIAFLIKSTFYFLVYFSPCEVNRKKHVGPFQSSSVKFPSTKATTGITRHAEKSKLTWKQLSKLPGDYTTYPISLKANFLNTGEDLCIANAEKKKNRRDQQPPCLLVWSLNLRASWVYTGIPFRAPFIVTEPDPSFLSSTKITSCRLEVFLLFHLFSILHRKCTFNVYHYYLLLG